MFQIIHQTYLIYSKTIQFLEKKVLFTAITVIFQQVYMGVLHTAVLKIS